MDSRELTGAGWPGCVAGNTLSSSNALVCPVGCSEAGAGGSVGSWKIEPAVGCYHRG